MRESTRALLLSSLQVAVPLHIIEVSGMSPSRLSGEIDRCLSIITQHGDAILYGNNKKDIAAEAFNSLARALAILAMSPGGVDFMGEHWEFDRANRTFEYTTRTGA